MSTDLIFSDILSQNVLHLIPAARPTKEARHFRIRVECCQIIQVAQTLEGLAGAGAAHAGPVLLRTGEHGRGLGSLPLTEENGRLQVLPQVRGDFSVQEFREPGFAIELLADLFRLAQLPQETDRHHGFRVRLAQRVELAIGTLQVSRETQKLAQEGAHAGVRGTLSDILQSSLHRFPEIARPVMVVRIHVVCSCR